MYLFDRGAGKMVPLPGLNTGAHEYSPALSPDGRFLVFVSERLGGEGERDHAPNVLDPSGLRQ